jgi:hypothetical protein
MAAGKIKATSVSTRMKATLQPQVVQVRLSNPRPLHPAPMLINQPMNGDQQGYTHRKHLGIERRSVTYQVRTKISPNE